MESLIVTKEIDLWDSVFNINKKEANTKKENENKINNRIYEIAIFKIFVKFEVFLSNMFIIYATGNASGSGYIAKRKLNFIDESHLKAVLKSNNKFIDYSDKIVSLSKHIFEDKKNPFDLIFLDSDYQNYYNKIKALRNYIAHESDESKTKYIKEVLCNKNFIEPYEHLTQINKRSSKSNYSIYVEKIREMTEIIYSPSEYLGEDTIEEKTIEEKSNVKI
ncbi:hypothetical protein P5F04_07555 [Clostridium perfringens]|uniref:hypothetical protein n=1 Tax=Clostridium perfringens TaxID=1502 RepID=UPI0022E2F715|nr:hypothetical protein [Clostridium perfringens]MDK0626769.1 hypothetical protein [Clostridium perfringens]MDK0664621.1 hypothetical protein [Clostridium perfringens]